MRLFSLLDTDFYSYLAFKNTLWIIFYLGCYLKNSFGHDYRKIYESYDKCYYSSCFLFFYFLSSYQTMKKNKELSAQILGYYKGIRQVLVRIRCF